MTTLSPEQLEVIKAFEARQNVLVIGPGGTGKSYVIRYLHEMLVQKKVKHAVLAYTGAACANVLHECEARTIHSWAGLDISPMTIEKTIASVRRKARAVMRWKSVQVLIIDEISMITAELFEKLDALGRSLRTGRSGQPFGGIQLVLCGDPLQLPPIFKGNKDPPKVLPVSPAFRFCFESAAWSAAIHKQIELKTIWRQADATFQTALSEIRLGKCSSTTVALLKSRCIEPPDDLEFKPTILYNRRIDVDEYNLQELGKLITPTNPKKTFESYVSLVADDAVRVSEQVRIKMDTMKADFEEDSQHSPFLDLAVGAQVMLIVNMSVEDGLVNGTRGIIMNFNEAGMPVVKFYNGMILTVSVHGWGLGKISTKDGSRILESEDPDVFDAHHAKVVCYQIPLRLAYAITCHKSQGMTLDCVQVDIGSSIFEFGQAYVSLSRARSLEGLYLTAFDKTKIRAHPRVLEFLMRETPSEDPSPPKPTTKIVPKVVVKQTTLF